MKKIIFVLFCTVSVAWTQPMWKGDGGRKPRMGQENIIERLKLSDQQQRQMQKLRSDMMRNQIALRSKIQISRLDMQDLFHEEKADQSKIESKIGEISKLQNEMKISHVAMWFNVNKLLTPEQQAIWKEHRMMDKRKMMQRIHGRMMKGLGMGEEPGEFDENVTEDSEHSGE